MKGGPSDNEEEAEEGGGAPAAVQGFEGMEALAKAIELGTSKLSKHLCMYIYMYVSKSLTDAKTCMLVEYVHIHVHNM